jgi:hypothetical protein
LVVTFSEATLVQMACLIPGHYEAGMRGTIKVGGVVKASAPKAAGKHDHGSHPH